MKSIQKQVKVLSVIVIICIAALTALTALIMAFLPKLSLEAAKTYTAEARMRVPVLVQLETALGFFAAICILGLRVMYLALKGQMYSEKTANVIRLIALCFFCISILQVIFIFYVESQVSGSITNLYSLLAVFACLAATALFMLFNRLTLQGAHYKQDSELTI